MKRFKKAYIEITNICNMNCKFCHKTNRKKQNITKEKFAHVIKEVSEFTDFVYFHLMGEPLLCSELKDFLDIAEDNNIKVNITTNGTLINKKKEVLLVSKALRKVSFSLHSFESNDLDITLDEYLDSILKFSKQMSDVGKIAVLKLWNLDDESIHGENSLNIKIIEKIKKYFDTKDNLVEILSQKANVKLDNHVYIQTAKKFNWPDEGRNINNKQIFCYGLRDQFGILVDGTVVPCCLDSEGSMNLGNIYETSLKEILYGPKANEIFLNISNGKAVTKLCMNCDYAMRKGK